MERSRAWLTLALGLVTGGGALACGAREPSEDVEPELARIAVPLETVGEDGTIYKLASATFRLTGPTETSIIIDQEHVGPWATADVEPGTYEVLLEDQWFMDAIEAGEPIGSPPVLISPNPQVVEADANEQSDVVFRFSYLENPQLDGDARVRIGIEVEGRLCGNGLLDPGEECDPAADTPLGDACDDLCTGGKECSQDTDCASGLCDSYPCDLCETYDGYCREDCQLEDIGDAFDLAPSSCLQPCFDDCSAEEEQCTNVCQSDSCIGWCQWAGIGCISCNNRVTACNNACSDAGNACGDQCAWDCGTLGAAQCNARCDAEQAECGDGCSTCVSCRDADVCPYLQ
jgi:hypothetical protein